jgi:hypothetical protein
VPSATVVADSRTVIISNFSWGAAFAGALVATAVSLLLITLGSGVGLTLVSPYDTGGPSAGTVAIAGVIWLIFAQGLGFAIGGYVAGRLRVAEPTISEVETNFRDGAHGLVAWAIGVLLTVAFATFVGMFAAGTAAQVGATLSAGTASGLGSAVGRTSPARTFRGESGDYFVDVLFRSDVPRSGTNAPAPGLIQTPQGETPPRNTALAEPTDPRAEVLRITQFGLVREKLSEADRAYVSRLVAQRTGVSSEISDQRVAEFERRSAEAAKKAADIATKSAAYFSFWAFMALLVGVTAAVIGAIWGGDNRDARPARPMFYRRPRPATVRR